MIITVLKNGLNFELFILKNQIKKSLMKKLENLFKIQKNWKIVKILSCFVEKYSWEKS